MAQNRGCRLTNIWGKHKIGFWGSYGMAWRIWGGNLHEISTRMQWNRSRDLTEWFKISEKYMQFPINSRSTTHGGLYVKVSHEHKEQGVWLWEPFFFGIDAQNRNFRPRPTSL